MLDGEKDGHELKRKDRRSKIKENRVNKGVANNYNIYQVQSYKDEGWAGGKVVYGEWRGRGGKAKGLEDI